MKAEHHLQLRPGTNVAMLNALAHVIVTEGLVDEAFVAERCETRAFDEWRDFVAREENSPEANQAITGVPAEQVRAGRAALRDRRQRGDLLRPGRDRTQRRARPW